MEMETADLLKNIFVAVVKTLCGSLEQLRRGDW